MVEPAPQEPPSYVSIADFTFDEAGNAYWLDHGRIFKANNSDLGGFSWWRKFNLPSNDSDPNADTNGNGQSDLYDYVAEKIGANPFSISLNTSPDGYRISAPAIFPSDVSATLSIKRFDGTWREIATYISGLWFAAPGVPAKWVNTVPYFDFNTSTDDGEALETRVAFKYLN